MDVKTKRGYQGVGFVHYLISDIEAKVESFWWKDKGLQYTASGYGKRIPTRYMIRIDGERMWRRVYCCIYGNGGTMYIKTKHFPFLIVDEWAIKASIEGR